MIRSVPSFQRTLESISHEGPDAVSCSWAALVDRHLDRFEVLRILASNADADSGSEPESDLDSDQDSEQPA